MTSEAPRGAMPSFVELADRPSLVPRMAVSTGRALGIAAAGAAATGAVALTWGQIERRCPTVRRHDVIVPAARGVDDLRILQISDLHMYPGQDFLVEFLRGVARTERVDLVVSTGDNLGSADGLDLVHAAYEPFLGLPGVFVLGSNDYYSPRYKHWAHYLRRDPRLADDAYAVRRGLEDEFGGVPEARAHQSDHGASPDLPWRDIVATLTRAGWEDLSNRSTHIEVGGGVISVMGVDDPHLDRDRMPEPDPTWENAAALRLSLSHAPYVHVVDGFTEVGSDLIIAGHTHGGQLGLPIIGALVTNCDLPRQYAKGLHTWRVGTRSSQLNVSAGLGTSPFVPLRVFTRPEVSLLRVRARG